MLKQDIKNIIKDWSVLFVDDDEFVLETMKDLLPYLFKESHFASNGIEGIELFNQQNIDLIITDFSMPKMNGLDMITTIKQSNPNIKVICVSGHNEKGFVDNLEIFSGNIMIKPISSAVLYNTLERVIKHG